MNEAKTTQLVQYPQGPVPGIDSLGYPLRPGFPGGGQGEGSPAHFDLPGHLPVRIDPGIARGREGRQAEYLRQGDHDTTRRHVPSKLRRRRKGQSPFGWILCRWSKTIAWGTTCGFFAVLFQIVTAVH